MADQSPVDGIHLEQLLCAFEKDVNFDAMLNATPCGKDAVTMDDLEAFLMTLLDVDSQYQRVWTRTCLAASLCKRLLVGDRLSAATLQDTLTSVREAPWYCDVCEDMPKAKCILEEFEKIALHDDSSSLRLQVLGVPNGLNIQSGLGLAFRLPESGVEYRSPGSAHFDRTGDESASPDFTTDTEKETLAALREHLLNHKVDVMVARSRGCRYLAKLLEEGSWTGPVLILSPAQDFGEKVLKAAAHSVIVAISTDDLIGGSGRHQVLNEDDLNTLRQLTVPELEGSTMRRLIEFGQIEPEGWSLERVNEFLQLLLS